VATRVGISVDDFLAGVDEDLRAEWVNGEVVEMSPVNERHAAITVLLTTLMNLLARRRGLGRVLHAPFHMKTGPELGVREPDLLFVRAENLSRIQPTYLDGPADLVIEVMSLESRGRDRGDKFYEYEQGGVPEYWIIDPLRSRVEAYRLSGANGYELIAPDAEGRVRSEVMDGMWIDPSWLWSEPVADEWWVLQQWGLI
jgi:Uma2 family endonuclease